jgi:ABC-type cobalamin/Fe3+-siderophores transport system ATPase subunit
MSPGNFLAVVGQVGCGKSSLLYSVMQETNLKAGKAFIKGSIAYVE